MMMMKLNTFTAVMIFISQINFTLQKNLPHKLSQTDESSQYPNYDRNISVSSLSVANVEDNHDFEGDVSGKIQTESSIVQNFPVDRHEIDYEELNNYTIFNNGTIDGALENSNPSLNNDIDILQNVSFQDSKSNTEENHNENSYENIYDINLSVEAVDGGYPRNSSFDIDNGDEEREEEQAFMNSPENLEQKNNRAPSKYSRLDGNDTIDRFPGNSSIKIDNNKDISDAQNSKSDSNQTSPRKELDSQDMNNIMDESSNNTSIVVDNDNIIREGVASGNLTSNQKIIDKENSSTAVGNSNIDDVEVVSKDFISHHNKSVNKLKLNLTIILAVSDTVQEGHCIDRCNRNHSKTDHFFELTKSKDIFINGANVLEILSDYFHDLLSDTELRNYTLNFIGGGALKPGKKELDVSEHVRGDTNFLDSDQASRDVGVEWNETVDSTISLEKGIEKRIYGEEDTGINTHVAENHSVQVAEESNTSDNVHNSSKNSTVFHNSQNNSSKNSPSIILERNVNDRNYSTRHRDTLVIDEVEAKSDDIPDNNKQVANIDNSGKIWSLDKNNLNSTQNIKKLSNYPLKLAESVNVTNDSETGDNLNNHTQKLEVLEKIENQSEHISTEIKEDSERSFNLVKKNENMENREVNPKRSEFVIEKNLHQYNLLKNKDSLNEHSSKNKKDENQSRGQLDVSTQNEENANFFNSMIYDPNEISTNSTKSFNNHYSASLDEGSRNFNNFYDSFYNFLMNNSNLSSTTYHDSFTEKQISHKISVSPLESPLENTGNNNLSTLPQYSSTDRKIQVSHPESPKAVGNNKNSSTIIQNSSKDLISRKIREPSAENLWNNPGNISSLKNIPLTNSSTADPANDVTNFHTNQTSIQKLWPVKMAAEMAGDLILGGLMMVHEREETITCGPIMPEGGVQALEVMLYTLDVLNARPQSMFKLGAHVLDDCDKDTYGLEMAVDFIKGSISNIDDSELHCNKTQVRKVISGVVGAASSVTSIQVANLLRLFKIPQVSFMSTSPELSNKQRFEYFTRTIPSDHYQVKAMVEIIRKLRWNYVSVIYEESNYGIKAFEELEALLSKHNICIAVKEKLVKDSGVAEDTAYDSIVHKLQTKPRARGAIVYGSDQEVAGLMRAVRRLNATGAFSWIGSDGWSGRSLVTQSNELQVEGTLSLQPQANPVLGFDTYFLNLTVENNKRNPWFVEFWEDHFQCRYPNSSWTPYNDKYTRVCTTHERLTRNNTVFENQLQFVSDAVMALAVALQDMHRDLCGGKPGLCDAMKPTRGSELLNHLRKVAFTGLSGDKFHFDENGDGPARYNIIHFKQISPGNFHWVNVGQYINGELHLDMPAIQFKLAEPMLPESVCSLPCEVGQAKTYVEGESCCWHCLNCSQYQIRDPVDETLCKMCPYGTVPDAWHQACLDLPEDFLRAESGWAIGAMSLSASGILVTLFVIGVFLRNNETPVVKASGRELSYVLLTGILLCYLITFAFVLRPTDVVCGVQRFGAGFCFTVVYAALLTKTNRISRIFNAGKRTAKRPSFITPKSQLIICTVLVSLQLIINAVWMLLSPPKAIHHYPTRDDNMLICSSYVDASYMIAFGYPIVLIIVCTVYAVLTRNIPEAFNESKHIGFTMYTTCVIWLAFVPLYFGTGGHMPLRITSMAVTISLSASVTIACLFSPKLYIILIRPEQNIRQSMMPNSRHGGTMRTTTAVASVRVGAAPFAGRPQSLTTKCSSVENTTDAKDHNNDLKDKSFISRSTQTLNTESHENTTQTAEESDIKLQLEAKTPEKLDVGKNNTDSTVSLPALNSNAPENNMLNSKTYRSTGDALMKDGATNCDSTKVRSSSSSSSHKSRSRRRRGRSKDKEEDETKQKSNEGSLNLLESALTSNGPSKL